MPSDHSAFVSKAIALSLKWERDFKGGPFGAVIVSGEEVISTGYNQVVPKADPTAHAEIVAIRKACAKLGTHVLSSCRMYTSCEPCPMCLSAIYWARIDSIWYACTHEDAANAGFDDSRIYDELSLPAERRSISMIQLNRSEGVAVFEKWIKSERKIHY